MSEALYRKYRPKKFKDVIGQEHVTGVLEGAIENGSISHAYLFSGSRGTGKTSVARIFASAIGASENDIYEIDAASNRGIDDIRALREGVSTLPFESPYKVYIIDEVHMLTKEAFNALLKTLEEPPSHAVFILATTEMEKLPETVVSRCQTFRFRKPSQKILRETVNAIAKKEGYLLAPDAADLIAVLGDGSFRDTEGTLQKVITSLPKASGKDGGKAISAEAVATLTGAPRGAIVNELIVGLEHKDAARALASIASAEHENVDMKIFTTLALEKLRAILLLKFAPKMEKTLSEEYSAEEIVFLKALAEKKDLPINSGTVLEFLRAYDAIGKAALPSLPLELAVMKLVGQNGGTSA